MTTTVKPLALVVPCPSWCTDHDAVGEVCLSETLAVDLSGTAPWMVDALDVTLSADIADGVTMLVTIDGHGGNTTIDGAEQYALAILDLVGRARAATSTSVPAQRTPGGAR